MAVVRVVITEDDLNLMTSGLECEFFDGPQKVADCSVIAVIDEPRIMND